LILPIKRTFFTIVRISCCLLLIPTSKCLIMWSYKEPILLSFRFTHVTVTIPWSFYTFHTVIVTVHNRSSVWNGEAIERVTIMNDWERMVKNDHGITYIILFDKKQKSRIKYSVRKEYYMSANRFFHKWMDISFLTILKQFSRESLQIYLIRTRKFSNSIISFDFYLHEFFFSSISRK
jgi:hypothetical protein